MHWGGAVLISPERQYIPMTARLCFDCTNNLAEYEACVMGIRATIDFKVKSLKIYGDSALVIHQIREEWETRDYKLIPYEKIGHKKKDDICRKSLILFHC